MTARAIPLAEAARMRQIAYRMFALLLLYPDQRRSRELDLTARTLSTLDGELAAFGFFIPWRRLLDAIRDLTPSDMPGHCQEHARLFGVDRDTVRCEPYESRYVHLAREHDEGWIVAQLDQTYRRAGLQLSPMLNERPDHAAVESEFMSYLCDQEAAAWAQAAGADGGRLLCEERAFLHLHLARWIGDFARDMRVATKDPVYVATADALVAFVHHDRDIAGMLAAATALRDRDPR